MDRLDTAVLDMGDVGPGHRGWTIERADASLNAAQIVVPRPRVDRAERDVGRQTVDQFGYQPRDRGMSLHREIAFMKQSIVGIYLADSARGAARHAPWASGGPG